MILSIAVYTYIVYSRILSSIGIRSSKHTTTSAQTDTSDVKTGLVDFVNIGLSRDGIRDNFHKYIDSLISYVEKANRSIVVVEYLPRKNILQKYSEIGDKKLTYDLARQYSRYFRSLERAICEKEITYTRIWQLSITDRAMNSEPLSADESLIRSAHLSYRRTLEHVRDVFDCTPELNSGEKLFQLYVASEAIVSYSFMIIDDEYIVSEYPRHDRNAYSIPDALYVDHSSSKEDIVSKIIEKNSKYAKLLTENKEDVEGSFYNKVLRKEIVERAERRKREAEKLISTADLLSKGKTWIEGVALSQSDISPAEVGAQIRSKGKEDLEAANRELASAVKISRLFK
ncbi:MAG: hypothetical protein AAGI52_10735 [Bacteroidota bacterium]